MAIGKTVNVIGATGLVGRALVRQLLGHPGIGKVRVFARRETGFSHERLEQRLVDFGDASTWEPYLSGDVLFSALGTTLKQAGSKEKQYLVDYTYQYRFAEAAARAGVQALVLVSSMGADSRSPLFYPRMKGELDEAVSKLPFRSLTILRPSILAGKREVPRFAENVSAAIMQQVTRLFFHRYRPIPAETVAGAMIAAASGKAPASVVSLEEIFALAEA